MLSRLKHRLFSAPVLTLLELQQPFEIETDAFGNVIGPFLTQQGHLVAYYSETLLDTFLQVLHSKNRLAPQDI